MRWGDPITTTVRGQGRRLGSKLAWVFQSRRRITIFVLIVVVIASSASYGLVTLNNKNAFRAAEDPEIELPGLDYVEYTTQDIFSQKLALIPPEQLSDYDKIALITELAGDNYFRLSTATERQDFLATWDTSPEYKQFATQAESGEGGAWQWLDWVFDYCEGGEGVGRIPPRIIEKANAQLRACLDLALTEAKTKDLVAASKKLEISLFDFEFNWENFFRAAREKCITGGEPGNVCAATAKYFKTYYSQQDLDLLYSRYWKDLSSRRIAKYFNREESARIKTVERYFQLKLEKQTKEAWIELGKLEVEIVLWFTPAGIVGKGLMLPFRLGGKAVTALAGSRVAAPWAYGAAIQTARVSDKIVDATTAGLSKINLTKMFAKSSIPTVAIKRTANSTINVSPYYYQNAIGLKISETFGKYLNDELIYSAVKASGRVKNSSEYKQLIDALASKAYVVSSKNMMATQTGVLSESCSASLGLANFKTGKTLFNETAWTDQIRYGQALGNIHQPELVMHEIGHTLSGWGLRPAIQSKYRIKTSACSSWNVFEEGGASLSAQLLAERPGWYLGNRGTFNLYYGYSENSIYRSVIDWQAAAVNALGRKHNITVEQAENLWLKYYYGYGLDRLGIDLFSGLPSSIRTGHKSILDISLEYYQRGDYEGAVAIVDRLRWK